MTEKVEVTYGDNSVEVEPRFYRIAVGMLTMGLPVMDVFQGGLDAVSSGGETGGPDDIVSIVFPDSDSMEFFSGFLIQHHLFLNEDGVLQVSGHFHVEMLDGDIETTYFVSVEPAHLPALEACLVAHTPSLSSLQN
jgi:hypothetical protein